MEQWEDWRDEWKCARMRSGGQCVTMAGLLMMPQWSANSWDFH